MNDSGPFSSIIDYEKEDQLLRQRRDQQQESQKKIQRLNAVGEALGIISDMVGGSQGATIAPRTVNPAIMRASDKIGAYDQEYNTATDRLKLQSLNLKAQDKQLEEQNKAARAKEAFDSAQLDKKLGADNVAARMQHLDKIEEINAQNKGNLAERELQNKGALQLESLKTKGDLQQIEAKRTATKALAEKGLFEVSRYDSPAADAIVNRNQVVGMLNDLKLYLRQKGVFPTQMPKVLQTADTRGKISDDDLKFLIGTYKEFFQPRIPELTGGTPAEGTMPGESSDKDLVEMFINAIQPGQRQLGYQQGQGPLRNLPGQPAAQPAQTIPIVKPDKKGILDASVYFN